MTISVVQTAAINNGFSGNFSGAVTAGNSIVMVVTGYNGGGTSVITTSSPQYNGSTPTGTTSLVTVGGTGSNDDQAVIYLLPNVAGGGTSLSVTSNSVTGAFVGIIAYEVSGLGSSPTLDKSNGGTGTGAGDQTSGASGNITQAPELIVGAVVQNSVAGTLPGAPWTNTTLPGNASDNSFAGYQVVTSSGSSYTYDATSGNASWAAVIATIYGTAAAAAAAHGGQAIRPRVARVAPAGLIYSRVS